MVWELSLPQNFEYSVLGDSYRYEAWVGDSISLNRGSSFAWLSSHSCLSRSYRQRPLDCQLSICEH